jgi:alkanesulfonate monooxygenase SsuD/methylene tetrahydromethanopterin reductase-like flavin-dependent oxidoreductase (luciferase family)
VTIRISFKTSPQGVDWATLDATWAHAGELGAFDGAWMNDHLVDMYADSPEGSLESLTTMATLVHHVPGVRVGHGVLSNTFRRPVLVAKAAVVLDHATRGNFVLGLGAGWMETEHEPFGITLPSLRERIDRLESAVGTIQALWSDAAGTLEGVTRADPFYPLAGARGLPLPFTPGGPPIFLGGQGPRGIALAARSAHGWLLPGTNAGDAVYFAGKRDEIHRALDAIGRDRATFEIVGQVNAGTDSAGRRQALDESLAFAAAGATEVILGMVPALGPAGLEAIARDVAAPLRDATG